MVEETIDVTCPRCGHVWTAMTDQLEEEEPLYKGLARRPMFRLQCPECGGHWLIPGAAAPEEEE